MTQGMGGFFGRRSIRDIPGVVPFMDDGAAYGSGKVSQAQMAATGMVRPAQGRGRGMGGVFGGVGNWLRSRDWEAIGAAMRDDPAIYESLMNRRGQSENDQLRRMALRQELEGDKSEREQAAQRQQATEAIISQLDPALQAQARVMLEIAPEAFARQFLGATERGRPHYDPSSGTWWIEDPSHPNGFRMATDENGQPIRNPYWQPPRPLVQFGYDPSEGAGSSGLPPELVRP